ncbi:ATP-grasp domain-containing protein, partial [Candidatus Pacearchaeota archaeon]|nr:ATP-grasp domain-containing protein [Candidatus Pacearchaeota archaeon]
MDSILVTGIGGGVGQSVIKSLQQTEYNVVGVDSEELAAGLYGVKTAYKGLYAKDRQFVDRLAEICLREKCSIIFPGHDVELPPLSENFESLKSQGIIPVVSSPEVINISDDKLETVNFLISNGFDAPETVSFKQLQDIEFPIVLKPQHGGARSQNTFIARNIKEFNIYKNLIVPDNCVVQEYIEGEEYTCGTVSFDGHCYGTIVMRRILRNGDTYKAFVENNSAIESQVHKLVEI